MRLSAALDAICAVSAKNDSAVPCEIKAIFADAFWLCARNVLMLPGVRRRRSMRPTARPAFRGDQGFLRLLEPVGAVAEAMLTGAIAIR